MVGKVGFEGSVLGGYNPLKLVGIFAVDGWGSFLVVCGWIINFLKF